MANKRFLDFTTDVMPSGSSFLLEADSENGVRKTTIENAVANTNAVSTLTSKVTDVFYNNAISHNGIHRGKDLTAYFDSGAMSAAIADGTFDNIYIGDFIYKDIELPAITYTDKSGNSVTQEAQTFKSVVWQVAGLDVHLFYGDISVTQEHHVVLMPANTLQRNVPMNPTADTEGAYLGSDMWKVHMPNWAQAIKSAFGSSHVLRHRELLTSATDTTVQSSGGGLLGKSSAASWTDVDVNIPNEAMIYGSSIWGSSFDVGDFSKVLPLFALKCNPFFTRSWFWLRSVASSDKFSIASYNSNSYAPANTTNIAGGIRPYFLLK